MIEYIKNQNETFAIIIRSDFKQKGIQFFTPNSFSQQLGYMNRKRGYVIDPHYHKMQNRVVEYTNEVLYLKSGKVRVDIYDLDNKSIDSKILLKGEFILLAKGGHGFEFLEESEIIEIKQGPYKNDSDKIVFKKID